MVSCRVVCSPDSTAAMMGLRTRLYTWLHKDCVERECELLQECDKEIGKRLKLTREMGEVRAQNEALTQSVLLSRRQNMDSLYETLFVERDVTEDGKDFLTPDWADREGEATSAGT